MLKVMRDNLKSLAPILWLVIAIFVLLVFANFGSTTGSGPGGSDAAATLGSFEVGWKELERAHQNLQDRMRSIYGDQFTPELAEQLQLKRQALEQLFNGKILLAEAERLGLQVSDQEVRDQVLQMFRDESGKFVGQDVYDRWTTQNYGGPARFEEQLREDLVRQKLLDAMSQSVYVSDADIEKAYREDVERAAIRYVLLPRSRFAEEAHADQAALQAYYDQHKEEYRLPEQRVIDYLLVDKGILRASMQIPDDELRAYYDQHAADFTREEQVRARHILLRTGPDRTVDQARAEIEAIKQRIEGGEDFAAVAREESDDPGSAAKGGDLGYFGHGRMTPEFEDAAFGAQTGELVGPVVSPFGVHLIEVTDRRPGGAIPFEEARETVRGRLASERVDAKAEEMAQSLRETLDGVPESDLEERMKALAGDDPAVRFETSAPFGEGGVIPGIGRAPDLDQKAFSLAEGKLADGVISTPRGPMIVRLAEVRAPRVQQLDEVEPRVRAAVEREHQEELAEASLKEAKAEIDGGASFDDAIASLGVTPVDAPEFGSNGTVQGLGYAPAVTQAALAAAQGDVVGPIETPQGAVLFEVTERKGFDAADLAQRKDEIRERLVQQQSDRLLSSLILERKRKEGGILLSRALQQDLDAGSTGG